jgi:hypothetical protein
MQLQLHITEIHKTVVLMVSGYKTKTEATLWGFSLKMLLFVFLDAN